MIVKFFLEKIPRLLAIHTADERVGLWVDLWSIVNTPHTISMLAGKREITTAGKIQIVYDRARYVNERNSEGVTPYKPLSKTGLFLIKILMLWPNLLLPLLKQEPTPFLETGKQRWSSQGQNDSSLK